MQMDPRMKRSALSGFTLIELLIVIAIIAILASILMPVLKKAEERAESVYCMNNTRELTVGWIMYQGDNNEKLMAVVGYPGGESAIDGSASPTGNWEDWTAGTWNVNNWGLVSNTLMSAFVSNAKTYKCPADRYRSPQNIGDRIRSYSMSGILDGSGSGAPLLVNGNGRTYTEATKSTDLRTPGPANIFVFLDEQADSIDDMKFMVNAGYPSTGEHWRNLPAGYHDGDGSFSFADGHSEIHKWMVRSGQFNTLYPVHYVNYPTGNSPWAAPTLIRNADYEWLDDRMPYH